MLLTDLELRAKEISDGHLTICRFTTNWRIGFFTPNDHDDIYWLAEGKTFEEAATNALARFDADNRYPPNPHKEYEKFTV